MCAAALVASCTSGPLEVTGTPPSAAAVQAACKKLVSALPSSVDGQDAVELSNGDGWAEAWGEPAIVLRCGVPTPEALSLTSECLAVNDIDWLATYEGKEVDLADPPDGTVDFTTVGRSPNVQVSVPAKWGPASDALVDVSDAVSGSTRRTQKPCT